MVKLDHRWRAWIPAVFILMSVFVFGLCLSAGRLEAFLGYFALSYALFMIPQGASLSMLQTSVNAGERALGTSIALLANSLVGLALGPLIIGLLSDSLSLEYGAKSLNYALLIVCSAAALIAAIGYQWTALAMSSDSSSDTDLNEPRDKL
jgi:MFS family permease